MTLQISDEDLMEALFRADKLLDGAGMKVCGPFHIISGKHSLDIFYATITAFHYTKTTWSGNLRQNIRARCAWSPSALVKALKHMREMMVLDDLAGL
jgi:hypothetical protein